MNLLSPHLLPVASAWRRGWQFGGAPGGPRPASWVGSAFPGRDFRLVPLALGGLIPSPAAFAESTNTLVLHSDLPDVGLSLIRLLAALAVVLALFFGGVWLFRNGQRLAWRRSGRPRLAIVESRALGSRFAIYVVGYDQQRFLVGSSPAGLALLSQLPPADPETPPLVAATEPLSFARSLQAMLKGEPERKAGGAK